MTSATATPNGGGYWILDGAGQVFAFGDADPLGGMPAGSAGGFDPASAIFSTSGRRRLLGRHGIGQGVVLR